MRQVIITICLFTILTSCTSSQDTATAEATSNLIKSQDYVFVAEYALPMGVNSIYLTSDYTLDVNTDSIVAYLPYFGRAYVAPINPEQGGIQFNSKDFDYKLTKKKNDWDIDIRTKDLLRSYQIMLSITSAGSAYLNVTSPDRQSISFNGYIEKRK